MAVRKVMTFKSGKFIFSDSITTEEINPKLIEYTILYETVRDLPILPALATKFESELMRRSIYSTAAMEGNPLAEETVGTIITAQGKQNFKDTREKEIGNLTRAYTTVKRMKPINEPYKITEKFVRSIHEVITHDIDSEYNSPGNYRNHLVKVGDKTHGGVYTPPKILPDIQQLMKEYEDWINNPDVLNLSPTIRAALAHFHLGLIHPFGDGNGRTARIIEGVILKKAGIKYLPTMLSNYYYTNIDEYFTVFSDARKNKYHDMTGFIDFFLEN
ncbi:MAG: Fic family protein [Thermodesulfobacteriota bacterium]|nr:Fic family protein [Thermodesulfobacteriota bacterium]